MDRLKNFFALIGLLLAVGLIAVAAVAVSNISPDAQSLGLGVMMGCAVGFVPLLLIGLVALIVARVSAVSRERRMMQHPPQYGGYGPQYTQPPVIVVGGAGGMMPYGNQPYSQPNSTWFPPVQRSFESVVIGEDRTANGD
jgi:hypothetical protein